MRERDAATKIRIYIFKHAGYPFHQAAPTFVGRFRDSVGRDSVDGGGEGRCFAGEAGQDVRLIARVSEGPEERVKLQGAD